MNESSFVPANDETWSKFFGEDAKTAIARLPATLVRSARRVTVADMRDALAKLPPGWSFDVDGTPWAVTVRGPTGELAMYAYGADKVAIQGYVEEVVAALGQFLADRCGPQVFSTELEPEGDVLFAPSRGAR